MTKPLHSPTVGVLGSPRGLVRTRRLLTRGVSWVTPRVRSPSPRVLLSAWRRQEHSPTTHLSRSLLDARPLPDPIDQLPELRTQLPEQLLGPVSQLPDLMSQVR